MFLGSVPSRLFVCLGFAIVESFLEDFFCALLVDNFFLGVALTETLGVGAGCIAGQSKNAEGEGIVIVAMKVRLDLTE